MNLETLKFIQIQWEGPYSIEHIANEFNSNSDFGVYLVYGPSRIYGPNVLLYIGKAQDQKFGKRIPQHLGEDWYGTETVYIGRLGSGNLEDIDKWGKKIDYAETKLIQACYPSWNASKLRSVPDLDLGEFVIINNNQPFEIPRVLADWLYDSSSFKLGDWKVFEE